MNDLLNVTPRITPYLDDAFIPASLAFSRFEALAFGQEAVTITLLRNNNQTRTYTTHVLYHSPTTYSVNLSYLERLIKALLWMEGAHTVYFYGPSNLGDALKEIYSLQGSRQFDVGFMETVYKQPFVLEVNTPMTLKHDVLALADIGRHLSGCRIGFDAGGSDRKVSALIDGEVIFSEEVVWHPKLNSDPFYHIQGVLDSLARAASHLPRVDAIGVSSAGVYIDNQTRVASLFRKVDEAQFDAYIKNIYINLAKVFNDVPLVVANDGDVTALAGAMSLESVNVLGIAMGTSEAVGYVNAMGHITGSLNELAFAPVDLNKESFVDEWSQDYGCGVGYFSQDAVIKLASKAGIALDDTLSPGEKLKVVQHHAKNNHKGAVDIFRTIGVYLGYGIAFYAKFYTIDHVLILGRVTSGVGGDYILSEAKAVIALEFPHLAGINIQLPDEHSRRVGQSIAAASLPKL